MESVQLKNLNVDGQIAFAHKGVINSKNEVGFVDVETHPYTTSLYPTRDREAGIYAVSVRPVESGESSPYYGILEDGGFNYIYSSIHGTCICFPYDVTDKLCNLVLIEVGKLAEGTNLRADIEGMEVVQKI